MTAQADLAFEGRGTSGVPLLLVHGFPVDRRMWRGLLERLGDVARVVALDVPGFGGSPPVMRDTVTMDDLADVVAAVADAVGFERFALGGLSMGGYACFAALRRMPERIERLILCDTRAEADSEEARAGRLADAERALAEGPGFFVDKMRDKMFAPATPRDRPELFEEVDGWMRGASAQGVAALLRGMAARPDSRPQLGAIAVPTLVIGGRDDKITPPDGMRAMARAIPGATCVEVPGGHLAPLEFPDEVAAAIRPFLRSH